METLEAKIELLQKENDMLRKTVRELEKKIYNMDNGIQLSKQKDNLGYNTLYKIKEEDPELFNRIIENS